MAQKSRFRTTSGPTANRSEKFKKKSQRDKEASRGGDSSFKKSSSSSDRKPPFKKSFGGGKPFQKRDFKDKGDSAPRSFGGERDSKDSAERKPSYSRGSGAQKRNFKDKESGKDSKDFSERKPKSFSRNPDLQKRDYKDKGPSTPRSFDADKGSKDFSERKPKSFSREDSAPFKAKRPRTDSPDSVRSKRSFDEKDSKPAGKKPFNGPKGKSFEERSPEYASEQTEDLIRLNKFISNSGICSRREADDLITMGLITVNGKSVTELGYKVKRTDDVRHDGKRLKAEKPVYILLNKPKGFITTTDDPQDRNTVMNLIEGACKERVYPVGRLDRNTSGLLLLTNDGDLTEKLSHPKHNIKKIYKAELDRALTKNDFQKILEGVRLEEGKAMVDDLAMVSDDGKTVGLEIHIGWNRIVRRIFEALGYEVVKLDRSVYATLDKKDLPRGHWRFLRQDEVIRLKHFQ
ncbi:MAG: pseudouridine synthase [Cyclobacteriaceae bacterium]|nr:pseudouridine synthase [Cyclobacteriaceae bacterium]